MGESALAPGTSIAPAAAATVAAAAAPAAGVAAGEKPALDGCHGSGLAGPPPPLRPPSWSSDTQRARSAGVPATLPEGVPASGSPPMSRAICWGVSSGLGGGIINDAPAPAEAGAAAAIAAPLPPTTMR